MTAYLFDEPPLVLLPNLAVAVGLHEAIFLQQVHYWTKLSRNEHEGHRWVYNTLDEWNKQFPYITRETLRKKVNGLEKSGLLIVGNFNTHKFDRTKWYRINYDKLFDIVITRCGKDDVMHGVKNRSADGKELAEQVAENGSADGMDCAKQMADIGMTIPEITQEITTETTAENKKKTSNLLIPASSSSGENQNDAEIMDIFESEFEMLWKMYPNKQGKAKALMAYKKHRKKKENSFEIVRHGLECYVESLRRKGTPSQYVKHGSTWFGNACWNDEIPADDVGSGNVFLDMLRDGADF